MLPVRLPRTVPVADPVNEVIPAAKQREYDAHAVFGVSTDADAENEDAYLYGQDGVFLVRDAEGLLEAGAMLDNERTGACVVAAAVPVPADWKVTRDRPIDRGDPAWKLVLVTRRPIEDPRMHVEGFADPHAPAEDATGPAPGPR